MKYVTNSKSILGKEVGTIAVSVYKDRETGLSSFCLDTENDEVIQVSYVIEDALKRL